MTRKERKPRAPRRARVAVVVDTSVARTSGDPAAPGTDAAACRDTLMTMVEADLDLAWSEAIGEEWRGKHGGASAPHRRYASRFALKWLSSMWARRRVRIVEPEAYEPARRAAEEKLTPKQHQAVEKDMHLVEAALASDRRVLSLDNVVRNLLARLGLSKLRTLLWANPTEPGCLTWLRAGAPDDGTLTISAIMES